MTFYTTIYGEQIELNKLQPESLSSIERFRTHVIAKIRTMTRTQLYRYYKEFSDDVSAYLGRVPEWAGTPSADIIQAIGADLSSRVSIAAGYRKPEGVADPALRPKKWTGNFEHSIYVFQVTKPTDVHEYNGPLDFFISRLQLCDEPQSIPEDGLYEAHQVRGREMIASFDVFTSERDVQEITAIRNRFSTAADSLLLEVFEHGYTHGIACAEQESPLQNFRADIIIKKHPVTEEIAQTLHIKIDRLLRHLSVSGAKQGFIGRNRGLV